MKRSKDKPGIMRRLEREGWRLLTKDRDNWKAKALAYREIIRKTHNALAMNLKSRACDYLQEINKLDMGASK